MAFCCYSFQGSIAANTSQSWILYQDSCPQWMSYKYAGKVFAGLLDSPMLFYDTGSH